METPWPPPPGHWSLTLPDGHQVVEVVVDEHGGQMHFTCTECGRTESFYCDLCARDFAERHGGGDHMPEDELPPYTHAPLDERGWPTAFKDGDRVEWTGPEDPKTLTSPVAATRAP